MRKVLRLLSEYIIFFPLLIEGLGLPNGHTTSYFLILTYPLLFYFLWIKDKKEILIPKKVVFAFIVFFTISLNSTLFAVNVQNSFEYLLYLTAISILFVYSYNNKDKLKNRIIPFIYGFSLLALIYSIILFFLPPLVFHPKDGYQFVYPIFLSHNHLGDLLVLPVILCIYNLYNKKERIKSAILMLLFTPFVILSFSRSAYFSLFITFLLIYFYHSSIKRNFLQKIKSWIILFVIINIVIILTFIISKEVKTSNLLSPINSFLVKENGLKPREFLSYRPEYFNQFLLSIKDTPFTGIGLNNFIYASKKYSAIPSYVTSYTTHNIFLDLIVGNGILSLFPLAYIAYLIIVNNKKNSIYFLPVAMFVNFQTDYTFSVYSYLLLFLIIIACIYKEDAFRINKIYLLLSTMLLFFFMCLILVSNWFIIQGNPATAILLYPINKPAYLQLLENQARTVGHDNSSGYLENYYRFFSHDPEVLTYLGDIAEENNNMKKALHFYNLSLNSEFYYDAHMVGKIYYLKMVLEGKTSADNFRKGVMDKIKQTQFRYYIPLTFRKDFLSVCHDYNWSCLDLGL